MKMAKQYAPHPLHALVFFAWVLAVQLTGLAAFTKGFFLTRVELERQSQCDVQSLLSPDELQHLSGVGTRQQQQQQQQQQGGTPSSDPRHPHEPSTPSPLPLDGCWLPPRFKRVVWVVVDALRYDFAAFSPAGGADGGGDGKPHSAGARHYLNHLPVINEAIGGGGGHVGGDEATFRASAFEGSGGMLFQFEADPPTVTMQRLKGLTTGGLPTFIDFRDNFHSPEIAEDNWVSQVRDRAAGRRRRGRQKHPTGADGASAAAGGEEAGGNGDGGVVFMGDDTWTSLYPTYFSRSYPFPSFNTRDLHTVDDGVLAHLSTELARRDWDVLVAHFLGVDHVGHTFGPGSQAMEDKLDQMNAALRTVFEGVDDDTVVFVLGDHGMTEDGNHGGATPEETGAALLVWSPSGERLLGPGFLRPSGGNGGDDGGKSAKKFEHENEVGRGGEGGGSADRRQGGGFHDHGEAGAGAGESDALGRGEGGASGPLLTGRKVAQIDLVPTISLLLGTPIPFGSLGGVIPEVFAGPYYGDGEAAGLGAAGKADADSARDPRHLDRLCDALLVNSMQVWRYLSEYAGVASMPTTDMFDLKELLLKARDAHTEYRRRQQQQQRRRTSGRSETNSLGEADLASSAKELRRVCDLYREFLDASIGLGRSLWTQYDTSLMWWGLAVLLAATVALASRAVASSSSSSSPSSSSWSVSARQDFSAFPAGPRASGTVAAGAAASLAIAASTDAVFGSSGAHVFAAKVAVCSSLGVTIHYAQTILAARAAAPGSGGRGNGSGTDSGIGGRGDRKRAVPSFLSRAGEISATTAGGTAGVTAAFTAGLSALYCAGLFSNSFIEAEDGLHRFLGASSLLSLAILFLLAPAPTLAAIGPSSLSSSPFSPFSSPMAGVSQGAASTRTLSGVAETDVFETAGTTATRGRSDADISRGFQGGGDSVTSGRSSGEAADGGSSGGGGGGRFGTKRSRGDRLELLFGLSPTAAAGLYAALAAACLRAAAAVQESAAEAGVPAESTFGIARSLLPLPALWLIGRAASGGGGDGSGNLGGEEGATAPASLARGFSTEEGGGGHNRGALAALRRFAGGRRSFFHGALRALSLAAVGAYWVNEAAAASAGAGQKHDATATAPGAEPAATASPLLGLLLPATRLLLPRATYLLCLVGLLAALVHPPARRKGREPGTGVAADEDDAAVRKRESRDGRCSRSPGVTPPYAQALAATAGTVVSHLVPAVVLVLGPGSPGVVMFLSAACGCVLRSVALAAGAAAAAGRGSSAGVPLGAVAVAWSVVGRTFFFLTGHHNQFSRLQYSAAFVGFDEFDFKIGGLLLFLNTFGTEILAALALPLAAAAAAAATTTTTATAGCTTQDPRHDSPLRPPFDAAAGDRSDAVEADDAEHYDDDDDIGRAAAAAAAAAALDAWEGAPQVLSAMERLSSLTLLLSSLRTLLSAANVSVQRGHLMLWAVFAPKFVFDATMQAVCGAAAVLAWAVVLVSHGGFFRGERRGDDGGGGRGRRGKGMGWWRAGGGVGRRAPLASSASVSSKNR